MGALRSDEHLDQLERLTRVPMLVFAFLMIPTLIMPEVIPLSGDEAAFLDTLDSLIWGLFALEFAAKVIVAPHRRRYLRHHWLDLLIVVLPVLRPLRVVRAGRAVLGLRLIRAVSAWAGSMVMIRRAFGRHGLGYLALSVAVMTMVGALLITVFEHNATNATVHSIGDGLWWAATTISTVGYGDTYPVTVEGKFLAIVLMWIGIGFFSAITAIITATFVETGQTQQQDKVEEVLRRLARLEELLTNGSDPVQEKGRDGDLVERPVDMFVHSKGVTQVVTPPIGNVPP